MAPRHPVDHRARRDPPSRRVPIRRTPSNWDEGISHVIPTDRFVLRRGGYVEQPPDLEYRPTGTTLAQAVERELDAKAWAAGAVHGDFELTVDGENTVDTLEAKSIKTLAAVGCRPVRTRGAHRLRRVGTSLHTDRGRTGASERCGMAGRLRRHPRSSRHGDGPGRMRHRDRGAQAPAL